MDQLTLCIELKCTCSMMPTLDMFHIALCICAGYAHILSCTANVCMAFCRSTLCSQPARKEKKRKDYAFRRHFNEKPSIIPGCPEPACYSTGSSYSRVDYPSDLLLLGLIHLSFCTLFKGALPVADHAEAASTGQARDTPASHPARPAPSWHC